MRPTIIFAVLLMALAPSLTGAQQAGENINVLPVVAPQDQNGDPVTDWQIRGDGFLQRQVEPTIAASTWNPDHLLAFFVDYRAVDIADDIGLGEDEGMIAAFNVTRTIMMAMSGLTIPEVPQLELPPIAASEAWVGMSRSYDGGLTWSGGFLPGAPFDESPASLAAPIHGLDAATDPVLAAGPCGKFYLVFMAFTRGDESKLVVARYQDNNYAGGGDHITYEGMTVVESGNNATHGYFLDKPDIEVDIARGPGAEICDHSVYVSYSTFNGLDNDGKFQSKVSFARSFDGGLIFDTQKLNPPYKQNQGSALTVDPTNGDIYMIWRHFNDPDAILMVRSTDFGKKWGKPVDITEAVSMAPFDQPSVSISDAQALGAYSPLPSNSTFPDVAFRSNGFPTAAVTADGTVFAAWQERVDAATGRPSVSGTPRIVVVHSNDRGSTWLDINEDENRIAVDMDWRDLQGVPAPGHGTLPQPRVAGPQVQPKLVFSGGQLLLAYYESRGRSHNYGSGTLDEEIVVEGGQIPGEPPGTYLPATSIISGYDRLIDFRAALLDPQSGGMTSSFQVSRYPISATADLADGTEDLVDVAPVNLPCSPDSGIGLRPCIRQTNRANAVQSAAGSTPFIGDYPDVAPIVQFVYDDQEGWHWATDADDLPNPGFHTIFVDNRHLLPPVAQSGSEEWQLYSSYDPPWESLPENLPGCINAGSRNTDVLTSRIDTSMVLNAPTTFKLLDEQRSFPFSIKNTTGVTRKYNLEIIEGYPGASFHRFDGRVYLGEIKVFAYSNASLMVYVETGYEYPVRVEVSEDCSFLGQGVPCTSSSGVLTFNVDSGYTQVPEVNGTDSQLPEIVGEPVSIAFYNTQDPENPFVINPFVINPFVINQPPENSGIENPFVINPFVINPFVINPFVINPFVINPFVINPFVINSSVEEVEIEAVIDTTWTVSPGGSNTSSSYLPVINIDNAQAFIGQGYTFQLIVSKGSLYGGLSGCSPANVSQPQILANVYPGDDAENPFVINPFVINPFVINQPPENPFVINPFVINPFVINSSFTMAPADNPDEFNDFTTKADPASDDVQITLRAYKLPTPQGPGATAGDGDNLKLTEVLEYQPWLDPPSLVIVPQRCAPGDPEDVCRILTVSPDLVARNVDTTPVTGDAGRTLVGFPAGGWDLVNEGLPGQEIGDATAENGILRHGFYVCNTDYIDTWDPKTPLDVTASACIIAGFEPSDENTLALNASEQIDPVDLNIPDVEQGFYYLVLHVDDTLQVSERTEINNWVAVEIFIEEPNVPPVASNVTHVIDEDPLEPLIAALPATDPNGDDLEFAIGLGPSNGSLTVVDGVFTYTPDPDFNGTDSFDFEASDGEFTDTATVIIIVNPINDPPVVTVGPVVVNEDGSAEVVVNASDVDGNELSYDITTFPGKGSVSPANSDTGVFTYTPDPNLNGDDSFAVSVGDTVVVVTVTVNVSITAVADAPVAQDDTFTIDEDSAVTGGILKATDADDDSLSFSLVSYTGSGDLAIDAGGTFDYTPDANFNGSESFTFRAYDGGLYSDPATVTIAVTAFNDPPTAGDASYETHENTPLNGTLIGSDIDGDSVTFSIATDPTGGIVTVDPANGTLTYTPANGFLGIDTFTFVVSDPYDASAVGTVTINVIDPVPNWDFIGFSTPWRPNYKVNAGSAIPLKWIYADPDSGTIVPSYDDGLEITATQYATCDATGDPLVVLNLPEDAGSSDLRYVDGNWQLNWDTAGLDSGCYFLSIYHPNTNQIDTENENGYPLKIQLK